MRSTTNMKRHYISLVLLLSSVLAFGQAEPKYVKTGIEMNAMYPLEDHGLLIIHSSEEKNTCQLTLVSNDLEEKWTTSLAFENPKKKANASKVEILSTQNEIIWINEFKGIRIARINAKTGEIKQKETLISGSEELEGMINDYATFDGELKIINNLKGALRIYSIKDNALSQPPVVIRSERYETDPRQFATVIGNSIYSYSYRIDRTHSKLVLNLAQHHFDGKQVKDLEMELKSEALSFAFNSAFDRDLVTFSKLESTFLFFGKLDYRFDQGYIENPEESGFAGFWLVRISPDLSEYEHMEYPFSEFPDVVKTGVISKQCMVDIKEDETGGIFFNFTVRPIVFDPKTYVFYLDNNLKVAHTSSGKIGVNFFDYNRYGVREISKDNNFKVPNDLLRYQSAIFLPFVTLNKETHAPSLAAIQDLKDRNKILSADEFYSFYTIGEKVLIIEYTAKEDGTLNIYEIGRLFFKF